jgi:hypothetical protein
MKMDKKQIEIIGIIALVPVMVLVWANSLKLLSSRNSKVPAAPVSVDTLTPKILPAVSVVDSEQPVSWGRCPFSGQVYSRREDAVDLILTGIIWDPRNPQALINGEVFGEGSFIGEFKIIKIYDDHVTISSGGDSLELRMEK